MVPRIVVEALSGHDSALQRAFMDLKYHCFQRSLARWRLVDPMSPERCLRGDMGSSVKGPDS